MADPKLDQFLRSYADLVFEADGGRRVGPLAEFLPDAFGPW